MNAVNNLYKAANYFIRKAYENNACLTPLKLIKLCYIAYATSLVCLNKPLYCQKIEAWRYGPVIRELYDNVKKYGNQQIKAYLVPVFAEEEIFFDKNNTEDKRYIEVLDAVWQKFSSWSAVELSAWTHQPNSAWNRAYNKHHLDSIIPDDYIKEEFSNYIKAEK